MNLKYKAVENGKAWVKEYLKIARFSVVAEQAVSAVLAHWTSGVKVFDKNGESKITFTVFIPSTHRLRRRSTWWLHLLDTHSDIACQVCQHRTDHQRLWLMPNTRITRRRTDQTKVTHNDTNRNVDVSQACYIISPEYNIYSGIHGPLSP